MRLFIALLLILSVAVPALAQGETIYHQVSHNQNCVWSASTNLKRVVMFTELQAIAETGPLFIKWHIILATGILPPTVPPATDQSSPPAAATIPNVTFLNVPSVSDFVHTFAANEAGCVSWENAALVEFVALNNPAVDAAMTKAGLEVSTGVGDSKKRVFPR